MQFAVSQLSVASVFAYFKYNKDCCFSFLDFLYNKCRDGCGFTIEYAFWIQTAGVKTA